MTPKSLDDLQLFINKAIESTNYGFNPENLYDPVHYTMSMGGKRIRPLLTLICCQLYGKSIDKAIPAAMALEIFHNSTLLHDDIMDNSMVRRNLPTVFKKWSTNIAILSGDAMIMLAYKQLNQLEEKIKSSVFETFNKATLEVCEGQQYDLDYEDDFQVRIEDYIKMIRLKTSVLLAASAKIGAIIGEACKEEQDLLYSFGENLGIAFQLQDDYLDTFGDSAVFGKKIGGDILAGKKTFLLLKALGLSKGEYNAQLIGIINDTNTKPEVKVEQVKEIYKNLKVDSITIEYINRYFDKAKESLAKLKLKGLDTTLLTEYSEKLSGRKY
ncbi:MAG: polyprenyl synthetase family protein [Salinivirgaceae bacterium]|nr:polyprenyl synthetase family protein [Salinivirgaceae bacterium]